MVKIGKRKLKQLTLLLLSGFFSQQRSLLLTRLDQLGSRHELDQTRSINAIIELHTKIGKVVVTNTVAERKDCLLDLGIESNSGRNGSAQLIAQPGGSADERQRQLFGVLLAALLELRELAVGVLLLEEGLDGLVTRKVERGNLLLDLVKDGGVGLDGGLGVDVGLVGGGGGGPAQTIVWRLGAGVKTEDADNLGHPAGNRLEGLDVGVAGVHVDVGVADQLEEDLHGGRGVEGVPEGGVEILLGLLEILEQTPGTGVFREGEILDAGRSVDLGQASLDVGEEVVERGLPVVGLFPHVGGDLDTVVPAAEQEDDTHVAGSVGGGEGVLYRLEVLQALGHFASGNGKMAHVLYRMSVHDQNTKTKKTESLPGNT